MSQLKQIGAMTRLNIRLQLTDPAPTLILTVIPLVLIPFMMPAFKSMLLADGYTGVTGAEQAVPSIAILFSFLAVQNIIGSFFNERSWGTWERLEASPTSRAVHPDGQGPGCLPHADRPDRGCPRARRSHLQLPTRPGLSSRSPRFSSVSRPSCRRSASRSHCGRAAATQPVTVEHHRHAGGRHRRFFLHGLFIPGLGAAHRTPVPRLLGDHRDSRGEPGRGEPCRRRGADRRPVGFLRGDRGAGTGTVPVSQGVTTTEAESPCRRHVSARYRETSSCRARSTWSDEEGLSALSLRSLGKRLGVSQAAFYRHFPDKAALLEGIAEQVWRLTFEAFLGRVDAGSVGVAATPTREASGPTGGTHGLAPADRTCAPTRHCLARHCAPTRARSCCYSRTRCRHPSSSRSWRECS